MSKIERIIIPSQARGVPQTECDTLGLRNKICASLERIFYYHYTILIDHQGLKPKIWSISSQTKDKRSKATVTDAIKYFNNTMKVISCILFLYLF